MNDEFIQKCMHIIYIQYWISSMHLHLTYYIYKLKHISRISNTVHMKMSLCRLTLCIDSTRTALSHTPGRDINIYDRRGKLGSCSTTNWQDLNIDIAHTQSLGELRAKNPYEKCMWNEMNLFKYGHFRPRKQNNNFIWHVNILFDLTWNHRIIDESPRRSELRANPHRNSPNSTIFKWLQTAADIRSASGIRVREKDFDREKDREREIALSCRQWPEGVYHVLMG